MALSGRLLGPCFRHARGALLARYRDEMEPTDVPRLEIDLSDRAHYRSGMPFELFRSLRAGSPVWWHPATDGTRRLLDTGFYVLSRHADLVEVARD